MSYPHCSKIVFVVRKLKVIYSFLPSLAWNVTLGFSRGELINWQTCEMGKERKQTTLRVWLQVLTNEKLAHVTPQAD